MDRSEVIKLRKATIATDPQGVQRETVTETEVFCQVDSVTQSEFFEGGRNGLNPEYRIIVFSGDYNDETEIEFKNKIYSVYRIYLGRDDMLELYVERKGGSNG